MRSTQRTALVVAAAVVLVVGFVLAGRGGSAGPRTPVARHFNVVVAGGRPVGGVRQLAAGKGDTIDLRVSSSVADEIHIHGYDLHENVPAGGAVRFDFKATIDGRFVIELESRGEQIATLTVRA